ncbi:hypothetical protein CFOL_v3_03693 [Cephalotus follicularis]|uniref:Uncharacterized protein n=1 Tax=Cephalotus follicularis TaxID=3775 RepID=A0A1Q3AX76_CEPFO|nr:hypothetical protein CFOL_v3_03693 [Cephalotus follicularis]
MKDLEPSFALAALNSGLKVNSSFAFSLLKKPALDMADLLKRSEKYINAEEDVAARKQKTSWSGHQEEKREHSRNAPGKKDKRKERSSCPKITSGISSLGGMVHPGEGCQSRPTTTLPPYWIHVPGSLPWRRTRSPSNGLRH